ncbi:MAG: DUF3301 domain-containing protein [Kangiellaceae bacterium]|nr:DUF3301 domain-containing protein [Kangiellaceae bacterium]MCW8997127.1 DUF3301 domain-containing protein [Kangiellaceae bacterium]
MSKVITLLLLGLAVYYWSLTQKYKSIAVRAGRSRCNEAGVQFLDHTVVHHNKKLIKDSKGNWRIARKYLFEFTSTGEQRYQGSVILIGSYVAETELEPYSIN